MNNLVFDLAIQIVSAFGTAALAYVVARNSKFAEIISNWFRESILGKQQEPQQEAYRSLGEVAQQLTEISQEFDHTLNETKRIADNRTKALAALETQLSELSKKETEMKMKVSELEKVSIPAVEYLLQATEKSERRSAKRDYLLFVAGVVASAIVSIILRIVFGI